MEAMRTVWLVVGAMLLACSAAQAGDDNWDDIFAPYLQRIDTATPSSGNAQNVNAATQMITPWPPYVRNRHIPGDGARMAGAVERYRNPLLQGTAAPLPQSPSAATPLAGGNTSGGTGNIAQAGASGQSGQSGQ